MKNISPITGGNQTAGISFALRPLGLLPLAAMNLAAAEREHADKRQYTLFNPTPRELMRELSADRPDLTESAYSVAAGHFQVEMDAVSYSRDNDGSIRTETYNLAALNLKAGLCNWADLQVMVEPYISARIRDRDSGLTERHPGFGDITPRVKVNLWGNGGGPRALAVMPFGKFPSNQDDLGNDAVEGGFIFPFAAELPAGWGLGAMTEVDFMEDSDGHGHHPEFINTITFGHDPVGNLAGYVGFFSLVSMGDHAPGLGSVNFGFTYAVSEDLQLDAGLNIGVTSSADDFNPFRGMSWRF